MTELNSSLRIAIGGPVGPGKITLAACLARLLQPRFSIGVITKDIYAQEDAETLMWMQILPQNRSIDVETGGYLHTAIRRDISIDLAGIA